MKKNVKILLLTLCVSGAINFSYAADSVINSSITALGIGGDSVTIQACSSTSAAGGHQCDGGIVTGRPGISIDTNSTSHNFYPGLEIKNIPGGATSVSFSDTCLTGAYALEHSAVGGLNVYYFEVQNSITNNTSSGNTPNTYQFYATAIYDITSGTVTVSNCGFTQI